MAKTRNSTKAPIIRKENVRSFNGRHSKSDAQRDFDDFSQEYPPEKGWIERTRQRMVRRYPDGKWYAETMFYRVINDIIPAR